MHRPDPETIQKAAFVLGVAVLAFLYGYAVRGFGWFPDAVLDAGWDQFRLVEQVLLRDDHPAVTERIHKRSGVRILDSAVVQPGLTLVPSVWEEFDWKPGLKLIGVDGEVVHRWRVDPLEVFPEEFDGPLAELSKFNHPQGAYLFRNGDVLVNFMGLGTARLDACSRVKWQIHADHHHSVARAADGTFWVAGRKQERAQDPITGLDSVRHDQLVHLSADGEALDEIDIFDIIHEDKGLLRRHLRFQPEDTHLNDVEPLPPAMAEEYPTFEGGDLLVSLRNLNVILVVNPETREVKWWEGEPFIHQHDPDFVGEGWIGVFDNQQDGTERGTRLGGSRIVAFKPDSDSTAVWMDASHAASVYTSIRGNWQLLENDNLLVTESNAGRVLEVRMDGRTVWEWIHDPYDEARVPIVYWVERYDLSRRQVAEWPCSRD